MATITPERIFVSKHFINPVDVTTITVTGISTYVLGHGKDNLKWEDPWLTMKATAFSGAPTIETTFASAQTINCFGFVNHSGLNGIVFNLHYHDGAVWQLIGTFGVHQDDPESDVLVAFDPVTSPGRTRFRLTFIGTPTVPLQIGTLFWGVGATLSQNPDSGVSPMTQEFQVHVEESAGGARQTIIGANKVSMSQQLVFTRLPWADLEFLRSFPRGGMLGIIPAEQSEAGIGAFGTPHVFGYLTRIQSALQTGNSILDYRYDAAIDIVGAV